MKENAVHDRIRKRLEAMKLSPQRASLDARLSRDYLRSLFNRPDSSPGSDSMVKLAPVLGTSAHWLMTGEGAEEVEPARTRSTSSSPVIDSVINAAQSVAAPDLPVFGLAAGAAIGAHTMSSDPVEHVPCPPGLARVRDAYALIVTGASMEPRYQAGDMIFLHPHRPPRLGDHIVIQEAKDGGTVVSIKRFERWSDEDLVTTQYNPLAEVRFRRDQIMAVHRVLTTNELFGI